LKPDDIIRIGKMDIFLFTRFEMERWTRKVIDAVADKTNMLAVETGVELLKLSDGQEISKKDLQSGVSFVSLMERNPENLKKGMQCP
jgi:zinc transport system substrate-binding protein